jgi:hypothetical protein
MTWQLGRLSLEVTGPNLRICRERALAHAVAFWDVDAEEADQSLTLTLVEASSVSEELGFGFVCRFEAAQAVEVQPTWVERTPDDRGARRPRQPRTARGGNR